MSQEPQTRLPKSDLLTPLPMRLYIFAHRVLNLLFPAFFGFEVSGTEHLPSGGCIIAANHASYLDPPILGAATPMPRQVRFMAKSELFQVPLLGPLITRLGAFPVVRGTPDRKAIRQAVDLLRQGWTLGIFPEGTRSKDGGLGDPEPGLALIATHAGVPVVPMAIQGTYGWLWRRGWKLGLNRVKVRFGPPLVLEKARGRNAMEDESRKVMQAISALKDGSAYGSRE